MAIATTIDDRSARAAAAHVREHTSVLAAAEKRVLIWLAERMPGFVTSDHLTALGLVAMIGAGLAFAAASRSPGALLLVPGCLAVNWFGDSLDGTLARVRRQQRPRYGYYLDHVVDLANSTVLFAGMATSGLMHPSVALAVLAGYLILCAESFLAAHAVGIFRLSFSGFGPTELRIVLAIGAVVAVTRPVVSPFGLGDIRLFDLGGIVAAAGMTVVFLVSAIRNGVALAHEEPLPRRGR
jgi:phosphatidylglycerophosphate synthase